MSDKARVRGVYNRRDREAEQVGCRVEREREMGVAEVVVVQSEPARRRASQSRARHIRNPSSLDHFRHRFIQICNLSDDIKSSDAMHARTWSW